jgi:cytochrome P450 / NADPH-cytochrome P450 reductase
MSLIGQTTIKLLEQFTPDESVEILHWTTNLTFETIGKVGFGYGESIRKKCYTQFTHND